MPRHGVNKYGITKEFLLDKYEDQKLTTYEIAEILGCSNVCISYYMDLFGVKKRKSPKKGKQYGRLRTNHINDDEVVTLYVYSKLSMRDVGKAVGCSAPSVARILSEKGITRRHHNDTKRGKSNYLKKNIDTEKAKSMYKDNESIAQIGKVIGVSSSTVKRSLVEAGVPIKSLSEILQGKRGGENNANYKPWLTEEDRDRRRDTHKNKEWRGSVFNRDGHMCLACGDDRGGNLCAHHILPYSIAKNKRWDVENGATLCKSCHVKFHSNYGINACDSNDLRTFINSMREQIAQLPR